MNEFYQKVKKFKNTLSHHSLPARELCKIYHVKHGNLNEHFFPAIGRLTFSQQLKKRRDAIRSHADYGVPGERAPCINAELGKKFGVSGATIRKMRKDDGVLPYISWERTKWHGILPHERRIYELCKKVRSWGRPAGIDEHLESLR